MGSVTFILLASLTVVAALIVILHRNPIYSALALVATLFLLAVFFLFLDAHLVAVLQIIVYAGAIMVLFLFVIMLLSLQEEPKEAGHGGLTLAAGVIGGVLLAEGVWWVSRTSLPLPTQPEGMGEGFGTVQVLARSLFTDFLLPFEITSVLLLVAIVGAVVLAQRRN